MRQCVKRSLQLGLLAALAACAHGTPPEPAKEVHTATIRIPAPCVVNRPDAVTPLKDQVDAAIWAALAPGAHAQNIKAQAGTRMNYEDRLRAATAACQSVSTALPP